jgi:hypothetical protein
MPIPAEICREAALVVRLLAVFPPVAPAVSRSATPC